MPDALLLSMRTPLRFATAGAALALGAPLGWLALSGALRRPSAAVQLVAASPLLYAYLLVATAAAFATFGAVLGHTLDALEARGGELGRLARTDALTGLPNLRGFSERLASDAARSARDGAPLCMAMMDLDHFKRVNDEHGHAAGDHALVHASRVVAGAVRRGDFMARVGGEEFALLFPATKLADAIGVTERARAALEATPVLVGGAALAVTASFGVAQLRSTTDAMREASDVALYVAKSSGRNRVRGEAA